MSRNHVLLYRPFRRSPFGASLCRSTRFYTFSSFPHLVLSVDSSFYDSSPRRIARLYGQPQRDVREAITQRTLSDGIGSEKDAKEQDDMCPFVDLFLGEWTAWPPPMSTLESCSSGASRTLTHCTEKVQGVPHERPRRRSLTWGASSEPFSHRGRADAPILSPMPNFSSSSSAVGRHVYFLWHSAVFRSLLSFLPLPPNPMPKREGETGKWERQEAIPRSPSPSFARDASTFPARDFPFRHSFSSFSSLSSSTSCGRFTSFASTLIPIAHALLHASLENGYDWALWRPAPCASFSVTHEENSSVRSQASKEPAAGERATVKERVGKASHRQPLTDGGGEKEEVQNGVSSFSKGGTEIHRRMAPLVAFSGTDVACDANIHAILTLLLPCLWYRTPSCTGTNSFSVSETMVWHSPSFSSRASDSLLHDEEVEQLEDMLLLSLLLPSPSTSGGIVARMQRDFAEETNPCENPNEDDEEEREKVELLCFYFRHLRSSPLSLSFATSLLSLPLLPTSLLSCILYRTLHDFFAACIARVPTMPVSQSASLTAAMFTAIVHALLNNDLFFTSPSTMRTDAEESVDKNFSPSSECSEAGASSSSSSSSFFTALHRLLLVDVFQVIPLWSSLSSRVVSHYDYYAYTTPFYPRHTTAIGTPSAPIREGDAKRKAWGDRVAVPKKKQPTGGTALHKRRGREAWCAFPHTSSLSSSSSSWRFDWEEETSTMPSATKEGRTATEEEEFSSSPSSAMWTWPADASPSATFFRLFARHVRWIPLLHKLSRLYTKNGRGLALVACQQTLLRSVPQVEVQWPCSFYGRVMGAVLDSGKDKKVGEKRKNDAIVPREAKGKGKEEPGTSFPFLPTAVVEWRIIKTLAQRAVTLYGSGCPYTNCVGKPLIRRGIRSNVADINRIWIILCKAALTLPPQSFGCYRLLEAYLLMIPSPSTVSSTSSTSTAASRVSPPTNIPSPTARIIPLTSVEEGGLQQLMRLVRGELHSISSVSASAAEEKIKMLQQLFHLLIAFMIAYTPPSYPQGVPSSHCSSEPGTHFVWWRDWWLRNGGFVLSDLWTCCATQEGGDVNDKCHQKAVMEAGRRIAQSFVATVEHFFEPPFPSSSRGGTVSPLYGHANWRPSMQLWLDMAHDHGTPASVVPEETLAVSLSPIAENVQEDGDHSEAGNPPASPTSRTEMRTASSAPSVLVPSLSLSTTPDSPSPSMTGATMTPTKEEPPCVVHCLLCGIELLSCCNPPASTVPRRVSECRVRTEAEEDQKGIVPWNASRRALPSQCLSFSFSGELIFHCGTFQYCTENDPFCCGCKESGGLPQVGYHCPHCLLPRPELLRDRHGVRSSATPFLHDDGEAPFYCWQCVREENEEEEEESADDTTFHGPFTTFSFLRPAKQCGQWNYSWVPRCVNCGEARIKSSREPRARAGIISRESGTRIRSLFMEQESPDDVQSSFGKESDANEKEMHTTEAAAASDTVSSSCSVLFSPCCPECGLPHASYQCPLFWDKD